MMRCSRWRDSARRSCKLRSVELARRFNVPLVVRSSFGEAEGTWVGQEDQSMEDVLVSGVTLDQNQSKITLAGVEDRPGLAAKIFGPIADAGIVVDMIIQNASADGRTDMTFTVGREDLKRALEIVKRTANEIGAAGVRHDDQVAKVSIVGVGMRTHAGVAATMFQVLAAERINIEMIATSEIKVSVVVNSKYGELAMRALHDAFSTATATRTPRRGRQFESDGGCKKYPDLRHHAARRMPVRRRFADGRGQGHDCRAARRSRLRLHRGRMAGLERSRRGVLQRGQEDQDSPREDCGLRLDPPRRSARCGRSQPAIAAAHRHSGRDRGRQDLGPARARGAADSRSTKISRFSTTRSRF